MSAPRIGDKRLGGGETQLAPHDTRFLTRMGSALGSPAGVLAVVPGLVLFVGALLTVIGQTTIGRSSLALGREQVQAQNAIVARQLGLALGQSDVILNRLFSYA